MKYVLQIVGQRGRVHFGTAKVGSYVVSYDPDAHNGRGYVEGNLDLKKAKRFGSFEEAVEYWRQVSTVKPTRPDGKPNRPLTAFSVTVMSEKQAACG